MTYRPATREDIVPGARICYHAYDSSSCEPLTVLCFRSGWPTPVEPKVPGFVLYRDGGDITWEAWAYFPSDPDADKDDHSEYVVHEE